VRGNDVIRWLTQAPPGTLVPARELAALLTEKPEHADAAGARANSALSGAGPITWRERLWSVPGDTRLGVRELAEAVGRSADWVYRHTAAGGTGVRLPHRKLDGSLVFLAGEVRTWLTEHEQVVELGAIRRARLARA
jgi:predicted DNA-binding transcriptional regulator AlpA